MSWTTQCREFYPVILAPSPITCSQAKAFILESKPTLTERLQVRENPAFPWLRCPMGLSIILLGYVTLLSGRFSNRFFLAAWYLYLSYTSDSSSRGLFLDAKIAGVNPSTSRPANKIQVLGPQIWKARPSTTESKAIFSAAQWCPLGDSRQNTIMSWGWFACEIWQAHNTQWHGNVIAQSAMFGKTL